VGANRRKGHATPSFSAVVFQNGISQGRFLNIKWQSFLYTV